MTNLSTSALRRVWQLLWGLLAVSAVAVAFGAVSPYLIGDPENSTMPLNPDAPAHFLTIVLHAAPGGLALLIGPFQFVGGLRRRAPKVHRVLGRVYLICVVAASAAAVFATMISTSGLAAQAAFYLLVAAWLYTLAQAYRTIRRGEVALHRIWMIRNYALTFAAVTLRLYLGLGVMAQTVDPTLTFEAVYTASAWASFVGNVLVVEYFIVQRALRPLVGRGRGRDGASEVGARRPAEHGSQEHGSAARAPVAEQPV
ncbi:putative membrane protein [Actinoalloteichus hoggarensis]|uniref:Uncharacterized protein n=1 Tax=Actinoalloteichus hoggarensis TaxID=1470176 RepID=A0A221W8T7_9PSEU|nr:DUF2306 domain-containing protein [Actinoalloteichus hoggarensis]ASO22328.1 hypothetical protein AHOG_23600 [Actinoalloteichus hoggarensis]MBB5923252.1 putative membrane protein [Actinoalloteichus hoggarensis]